MLKINLIVVGKLKKNYLKETVKDYQTRCRSYADFQIKELKDFGRDDERKISIEKESRLILNEMDRLSGYSFLLDIQGHQFSSEEMAEKLDKLQSRGISHLILIIGGSYGVNEEVRNRVNERISFSKLTFPHGLMRGLLAEQIYRWLSINAGSRYHK